MNRQRLAGLDVWRYGADSGPAVLLCHGFGAPGDDLVPLAEALDPQGRWRWFFPEAPLDLRSMGIPGRAWWQIDMMRLQMAVVSGNAVEQMARETPPELAPARAALEALISELESEHGVEREKLVLGGFSQGAMLATEVALHAARPFAGLALLSGTLLSEARWRAAAAVHGAALHVFQSHGQYDPILPFAGAERLRDLLTAAGADLRWVGHRGGHEIPGVALQGLRDFLRERLG